jgi:SOS response regulatory protein OraA/RecX
MYTIEEFDKQKTKVLKYVLYKKRTIYEVKQKFKREINEELLDEIIQNLEENNYLNDEKYIRKSYI